MHSAGNSTPYFALQLITCHSASLCTDPPKQTTTQQFFLSPKKLKNLASPQSRQKALIIPILCTYLTITAYKHILIASYVTQVI